MNRLRAYQHSTVVSWMRRSATGACLLRQPGTPVTTLESAMGCRILARRPALRQVFSLLAVVALIVGILGGQWGIVAMALTFLVAQYYPVGALALIPTLLIWSPRLPIVALGDEVFYLRLDQAAIGGMVLALFRAPFAIRTPPAHTALLLFLTALPLSIIAGVFQGTLTTPTSAALYLAQWYTWYALYVAAYSLGDRLGDGMVYAWALPLLAFAAYGLAESLWPYFEDPGVRYRTFERGFFPGQANHAGGLLALATVTGLALTTTPRHRLLGLTLAVLSTCALMPTGSRSGVLAWAAGAGLLALVYLPPLRWWAPPMAIVAMIALPASFWYRFSAPGSSMYDRLVAWKSALSTFPDYPLLGLGAGARHRSFYDNQFLMTLAESGLVGLGLLAFFLATLFWFLAHQRTTPCRGTRSLRVGALASVAVLAIHSMATASLIVTLTAGPFFWYCGTSLGRSDTHA